MQITDTNKEQAVPRKVVTIPDSEIKKWKRMFMVHGTKTDFERESGIPRQTLMNVIGNGYGQQRIVNAIRNFINENVAA